MQTNTFVHPHAGTFIFKHLLQSPFFCFENHAECQRGHTSTLWFSSVRSVQSGAGDEMQHKDAARLSTYHYPSSGWLYGLMGCYTDASPRVCYIICLQWCCRIDHLLLPDKQSDLQKKAAAEMLLPYLSPGRLIPSCYHYINELIPPRGSANVLV